MIKEGQIRIWRVEVIDLIKGFYHKWFALGGKFNMGKFQLSLWLKTQNMQSTEAVNSMNL